MLGLYIALSPTLCNPPFSMQCFANGHHNTSWFVEFFDTFSCECRSAHLAYLNLCRQWIKVIAPPDHCSISYRTIMAATHPDHSNAITKPLVGLQLQHKLMFTSMKFYQNKSWRCIMAPQSNLWRNLLQSETICKVSVTAEPLKWWNWGFCTKNCTTRVNTNMDDNFV